MKINVKSNIKSKQLAAKATNDLTGNRVANEFKRYMDKYTPRRDKNLINTYRIKPFIIEYLVDYAHYIWTGILYVDPDYEVGAFYSPKIGFWSRPGIKKKATSKKLNFRDNPNPNATNYWDKAAWNKHGQDLLEFWKNIIDFS